MKTLCKCHGVSASCAVKICWRSLAGFNEVGDSLKISYDGAKKVRYNVRRNALRPAQRHYAKPSKQDLVYFQESPNFCDFDNQVGSLGTTGRTCNRTSQGLDSCSLLCCGRGFYSQVKEVEEDCNCRFVWCCKVQCDKCRRKQEFNYCKWRGFLNYRRCLQLILISLAKSELKEECGNAWCSYIIIVSEQDSLWMSSKPVWTIEMVNRGDHQRDYRTFSIRATNFLHSAVLPLYTNCYWCLHKLVMASSTSTTDNWGQLSLLAQVLQGSHNYCVSAFHKWHDVVSAAIPIILPVHKFATNFLLLECQC